MTQNPFEHSCKPGMLQGVRVVETTDELGEYCGLLLAGLGAALCLARRASAQGEPSALLTRPIPRSGEKLPVIGLGIEIDRGALDRFRAA